MLNPAFVLLWFVVMSWAGRVCGDLWICCSTIFGWSTYIVSAIAMHAYVSREHVDWIQKLTYLWTCICMDNLHPQNKSEVRVSISYPRKASLPLGATRWGYPKKHELYSPVYIHLPRLNSTHLSSNSNSAFTAHCHLPSNHPGKTGTLREREHNCLD